MHFTYWLGRTIFNLASHGLFDLRIIGAERMHFEGPALIAANHASFLDPPFIGASFPDAIHYFARKTLMDHPLAGWILREWQTIPIDRDKPDASSLKHTIRLLKAGGKVLIFPEGTRTADGELKKAEAGVGLFIAKTRAPVLPVRIFGTYEAYPKGAKFPRPSSITLVIGEKYQPDLDAAAAQGRNLYQALADEVMEKIAALKM